MSFSTKYLCDPGAYLFSGHFYFENAISKIFRSKMNNLQTDVYEFLPSGKHFRKYFSKNGVEWISKQQCELCICSKLWIFSEFEELKRSLFSRITDVFENSFFRTFRTFFDDLLKFEVSYSRKHLNLYGKQFYAS